MQLSQHFSLAEFLRSETAARHDIDMTPSPEVIDNLRRLCLEVLEPIRTRVGAPIVITSGWRPVELNRLVGGSLRSDHVLGLAADIHAVGVSLHDLGEAIRAISAEIPLKQAIHEFSSWIHVSVMPEGEEPKREFLLARREQKRTVYEAWA